MKNASEPVRARLVKAVTAANMTNTTTRNKQQLLDFLRDPAERDMNQRELVSVLRSCWAVRPDINAVACSLLMETAAYLHSRQLGRRFAEEIRLTKAQFDIALTTVFANMKHEANSIDRFFSLYAGHAGMVLDMESVDKILAVRIRPAECAEELRRVVAGSRLGAKLFSDANREARVAMFNTKLSAMLGDLAVHGSKVSKKYYEEVQRRCYTLAADIADEFSEQKSPMTVEYMGIKLDLESKTPQLHVRSRLSAVLKTMAVGRRGGLPPLPWEVSLLPPAVETVDCPIPVALMEHFKVCRDSALDALRGCEAPEHMLEIVRAKKVLFQLDDTFCLEELALKTLLGPWGRQRLLDRFIACLPSPAQNKTLGEAVAEIGALAKTDIKLITSRSAQGEFGAWSNIVSGMCKGVSPDPLALAQDDAHRAIAGRLGRFFRQTVTDKSGMEQVVFGQQAVQVALEKLEAEKDTSGDMQFLSSLHAFRFLMSADQLRRVSELTSEHLALAAPVDCIVPLPDPKPKKSKRKAGKASANDGDPEAETMEAFFT